LFGRVLEESDCRAFGERRLYLKAAPGGMYSDLLAIRRRMNLIGFWLARQRRRMHV